MELAGQRVAPNGKDIATASITAISSQPLVGSRTCRFPEIPSSHVLAQARYAYLWDRYEEGRACLRPIFEAYKQLRIALEQEEPKDAFTAGYLALCGALGKPTQIEDKPKNVAWAVRLLARYPVTGNAEWAGLLPAEDFARAVAARPAGAREHAAHGQAREIQGRALRVAFDERLKLPVETTSSATMTLLCMKLCGPFAVNGTDVGVSP